VLWQRKVIAGDLGGAWARVKRIAQQSRAIPGSGEEASRSGAFTGGCQWVLQGLGVHGTVKLYGTSWAEQSRERGGESGRRKMMG
jgi:hypothetical protein